MNKKCGYWIAFTVGLVLIVIGCCLWPVSQIFVRSQIEKAVVLNENAKLYDIWRDSPIPIYMQFYMFNLTNPDEVRQGGKPAMVQKGPYTYREYRKKNIEHWNPNGTVTYRQTRNFIFMPNMSVGSESDQFTTVNPPFMTLAAALRWQAPIVKWLISIAVDLYNEDIFMTRSMKEIIWGYVDPSLHEAKKLLPKWFYTDFIGYFMNKNNTDDGLYTVFTGESDIGKVGVIDKYNGSSYLDFWTSTYANMVNGSDGTVAPPFLADTPTLPMFSSDICRSITGQYSADVETPQGIALHRYTATADEMANVSINPDNIGFCTPHSRCMDSGVLNISTCQLVDFFHIPVVVSFPHFYLAADEYVNGVYGMHPNKEEHETFVDVHPMTGLVLQVAKRLQVNMYIESIPDIKETHNVSKVVMPIFWLNESAVVDDSHADMLKDMLLTPLLALEVVCVVVGVGGLVVWLAALSVHFVHTFQTLKKKEEGEHRAGETERLLNTEQNGDYQAATTTVAAKGDPASF